MPDGGAEVTEDRLLAGRVRLRQLRRGHRIGTDAVLLAATVAPSEGDVVCDIGAGAGGVGLMLAARANIALVLVERDPTLVELCRENVALNGYSERARVIEADILAPAGERRAAGLEPTSADIVVTNPPFLEEGRSRPSPDGERAAAHQLAAGALEPWLRGCADLLRFGGRLALIHRADRIADCLALLGRGFGEVAVRGVHPRADAPAVRMLLTAVRGSRAPMSVLPPVVLHDLEGRFTAEAEAIHRGEALLVPNENGRRKAPDP